MKKEKITMNASNKMNSKITFDEGYDEFIRNCKVRNLRPATIKHYDNSMKSIYKFINPKMLIKDITSDTVDEFILFCKSRLNIKDVTIATYIKAFRAILYYFMKLGYMKKFKIPGYKFDKDIIEVYSDSELELLLKKPNKKKCSFVEFRSWTIINFLMGTGCRVHSLINIKNKDIDFENDIVYMNVTKNRKPLIIPLSKTLIKVLEEYIGVRGGESDDYLFCTETGERVKRYTINCTIKKYNEGRGVMKSGLHRFRHTFAKKWILSGGDVFKLQKILGHSDLQVVKNYVNIFTEDLQQNFDIYNPLEQLNVTNINTRLKLK